jgi:pyruvate formate-lyase activating enzyme-like uncharacterized protein
MPLFFFHVQGSVNDEGFDMPSIAQAKREAVIYAGNLLAEMADTFWNTADLNVSVSDETNLTMFAISITGLDAPVIRYLPTNSV